MKNLYLYCILFSLVNCTSESKRVSGQEGSSHVENTANEKPPFWKEICKLEEFEYMYYCHDRNCYQIELHNSPFKDLVVITLDISDSTRDLIYYNRFKDGFPPKVNNEKVESDVKLIVIVNPVTRDSIKYFYKNTSKIILNPKNKDVNIFLSDAIWGLSAQDGDINQFDPEIWKLKGRSGGKEILLSRHIFKDSIFYSNIQKVLDICKIKDYKYMSE